jgi:cold shock CspA family protein
VVTVGSAHLVGRAVQRVSRRCSVYSRLVQGVVKVWDPATGVGIIIRDDDRSEVFLRAGSLRGSVFRMLRQGQRVIFEVEEDEGRIYAHRLRFGSDGY